MDFDIDAVLDQLERTLNQSNHEEKQINQATLSPSTSRKSVDDLLLLDLDPLSTTQNENNQDNDDDKIEQMKQDLEELYSTSTVTNPSTITDSPTVSTTTTTLPDIIGQQDELSSTSLPVAVEKLEAEVRQEILQHTSEQPSSPLLLPDLTNLSNNIHDDKKESDLLSTSLNSIENEKEEEEKEEEKEEKDEKDNLSSIPINESTNISKNSTFQNEPDLIQHETSPIETPTILHSVDSIVNAPMTINIHNYIPSNPSMIDIEPLQLSSDVLFTACDEDDNDDNNEEESIESLSKEPISNSPIIPSSPPPSPKMTTPTTTTPTQDFDLVKNILSEIFDKSDEEILDENNSNKEQETDLINIEQQEIPSSSSLDPNNDEDFRFLDEMLASIDVSNTDIHQLTPAEIDRVDNLLKQIVNTHQTETLSSPSTTTNEIEPSPPSISEQQPIIESSLLSTSPPPPPLSSISSTITNTSIPINEELIRVEQEWSKLTDEEKQLGSIAPEWISDDLAPACMKCGAKFSITRRRHHCRACGKVFCSTCCWQKIKLIHDDSKEDRACNDCIKTINHVEYLWNYMRNNQKPRSSVLRKKTGRFCMSVDGSVLYGTV